MSATRFDKLAASLRNSGLDAVALNPGPTLVHLTGLHFHLMERPVVLLFAPGQAPAVVLPELETQKLVGLPFGITAFPYGENPADWNNVFESAVRSLGLDGKAIGVETLHMRLLEYGYVKSGAPGANFPDASAALSALRIRKDAGEIGNMRKAVKVAQNALEAALKNFKVGMTEKEFASELTVQLLRGGSEPEMPFSPIVSGGLNGANPHASPSDRPIVQGDLLVIDWGDGQFFTHRTGHGIGMEGHEEPYMRGDNRQLLEEGMAYTVEPGIYLPGRNGVRIEDDMVVTKDGSESLSDMPRKIRVIG
jgi:Xaa-Pro dipeptidase